MVKRDSAGSAARISTQSPSLNQLGMDCAPVKKKNVLFFQDQRLRRGILLVLVN